MEESDLEPSVRGGAFCPVARMLACVYPPENFEAKSVTTKLHHGKSKRKSKSLLPAKEKQLPGAAETERSGRVGDEVRFWPDQKVRLALRFTPHRERAWRKIAAPKIDSFLCVR